MKKKKTKKKVQVKKTKKKVQVKKSGKRNIKGNKDNKGQHRKSKVVKKIAKKKQPKQKKVKKSTRKKQAKRYGKFLVSFTAFKTYSYAGRENALEAFTRTIPIYRPITKKTFRREYLQDIIKQEIDTFTKIEHDTEGAVMWSNWSYSVRTGDEDEEERTSKGIKIKEPKHYKTEDEDEE